MRSKMPRLLSMLLLCWACGGQAALVDRGGGMVHDPERYITWLQDWRMAAGSVYDDGHSSTDGLMRWESANAWAQNLVYGGYDDWRLPSTAQPDPSCSNHVAYGWGGLAQVDFLWGCEASELGHLFHHQLGGQAHASVRDATGDTPEQQANLALLHNLQTYDYWSDILPGSVSEAWSFGMQDGRQFPAGVWHELHAVAVRSGDVPEPPMSGLLLLALAAAALAGQNRKYFCAIGSTVAGSQVSSTPSARTW